MKVKNKALLIHYLTASRSRRSDFGCLRTKMLIKKLLPSSMNLFGILSAHSVVPVL